MAERSLNLDRRAESGELASDMGAPLGSSGDFLLLDGEPYACIRDVDRLAPFLMSVVSNGNLWMFVGSNGAITAGRRDPDGALFPYQTADQLLRHPRSSGSMSIFLVEREGAATTWEPWSERAEKDGASRHLYKHAAGTSVIFEEIHRGLGLRFRWSLAASEEFGLVRRCTLENLTGVPARLRYLDGWRLLLPHGVRQETYSRYSYLASAYMRHELLPDEGLGIYTLNSGITDRAEPSESLRISCAWSLGHVAPMRLLSERQIQAFRHGRAVTEESEVRGEFGAYLGVGSLEIPAGGVSEWFTVADIALDHRAVVALRHRLQKPDVLWRSLVESVAADARALRSRIAAADGLQQTADRPASIHHFANVLFNCMRGGTLNDGYHFPGADFASFLQARNRVVRARHQVWLESLPARLTLAELHEQVAQRGDRQLIRLAREYLPLSFSRRHGDPSRPWNRFVIQTKDEDGRDRYDYQGNWRDIFQNWEGLAQSYPACLGAMISVFLNASTADGYNPYRIGRDGIDWEVLDPEDPWSHIGYWGDHQIVYLLRLLESYEHFWPGRLAEGLGERLYACATVPYEITGFAALVRDPRHSISFRKDRHERCCARAKEIGGDGKLLAGSDGEIVLVSLAEKLLVPLLVKLGNLIPGGGIWLNTQRPEWNDANNALVGWGLSMVTVCYIRRHVVFLDGVFAMASAETVEMSVSVAAFLREITAILRRAGSLEWDDQERYAIAAELGAAGERYRDAVYARAQSETEVVRVTAMRELLAAALPVVDATIRLNRRSDGMYHSYNLLGLREGCASVQRLSLMLEGQVAAISSGLLSAVESLALLTALRASALYRADQNSYLLYPDQEVVSFLGRNTLPEGWREQAPVLANLIAGGHRPVVVLDETGAAHFQADLTNVGDLERRLDAIATESRWSKAIARDREAVLALWEAVFHHHAFTGRSGTMFAFEGLGSIYWHMVAKLLLAVQECHRRAVEEGAPKETIDSLQRAYRDVRSGLGFTKTPSTYGAFPTDPYSHTPRDRGAQQPGMTGQVKEEILTRLGELGVEVCDGCVSFVPRLLDTAEFAASPQTFSFIDITGEEQKCKISANGLAFTFCQVPVVYLRGEKAAIVLEYRDGEQETILSSSLTREISREIFDRTGCLLSITVHLAPSIHPT